MQETEEIMGRLDVLEAQLDRIENALKGDKGKSVEVPEYWDLKDTSAYMKLNPHTIRRMCAEGELPYTKAGSRYRFLRADIDAYLNGRKVCSNAEIDARADMYIQSK